jgi:hypothetical protein
MKVFISVFLAILFLLSVSTKAGVIVKMTDESKGMNMKHESTMYIEKDRLRMDQSGEGQNHVIIFRGDKNVFWTIDHDKKSYFEMTQDDVRKMKAKMDDMQKMMMEQMKNMPAEQRKMMEQMMPSSVPTKEKVKTKYQKKASGVKIGKWNCTHYLGYKEDEISEEIWVADWKQIGVDKSELKVLNNMGKFFEALSQEAADFFEVGSEEWEKELGMSGAPVRSIHYMDGKPAGQSDIKEVTRRDLKSSLFELPAGYSKGENPWENQGAGMSPF